MQKITQLGTPTLEFPIALNPFDTHHDLKLPKSCKLGNHMEITTVLVSSTWTDGATTPTLFSKLTQEKLIQRFKYKTFNPHTIHHTNKLSDNTNNTTAQVPICTVTMWKCEIYEVSQPCDGIDPDVQLMQRIVDRVDPRSQKRDCHLLVSGNSLISHPITYKDVEEKCL